MASMGLLGMAQGLGDGMSKLGQGQMAHALDQEKQAWLEQKQARILQLQQQLLEQPKQQKREAFVGEIERMRNDKLGADAQHLDQAAQIYQNAEGLSNEERQAGIAATSEARTRLGNLTPEEVGMAGLRTGNLEARDYLDTTARAETSADKMAIKLLQEDRKDARQVASLDSRENIAEARNTTAKEVAARRGQDGGRLSLPQQVQNKEIDAARRIVAGLSEEEIKKRTAKFTNTGRDNPDYDEGLARRLRIAAKRKYGDDDWFDQQSTGEAPLQQAPTPAKALSVMERFQSDATMKSYKTGKVTDRGLEVLDTNGKLIGHYR